MHLFGTKLFIDFEGFENTKDMGWWEAIGITTKIIVLIPYLISFFILLIAAVFIFGEDNIVTALKELNAVTIENV